jgi:phthalate 4,5-dioxygenase oxygenase subunit
VFVPVDDTTTMFYFVAWSNQIGFTNEAWRRDNCAAPGVDLDAHWRKKRTLANDWLQDREAMKNGDFTGIAGVPNQDMAVQESMGPIVDRTSENLGASDIAVVRFRQMMLASVKHFVAGGPAIGTEPPLPSRTRIRSFEGIVPKTESWNTLGATDDEIASYRDALPGAVVQRETA